MVSAEFVHSFKMAAKYVDVDFPVNLPAAPARVKIFQRGWGGRCFVYIHRFQDGGATAMFKTLFLRNLYFHAIFFLVLVTFNHYYCVKFKCEPTYVFISRLQSRIVHKKNEIALHGASELVSMKFFLSLLFNKV